MQPGSLVFLAILAIWAGYLLQHWVRRREYLATARSVDRYSEAMRVLERRTPVAPPAARNHPSVLTRPSAAAEVVESPAPARGSRPTASLTPGPATPAASSRVGLSPTAARIARVARLRGRFAAILRGSLFLVALVAVPTTAVLAVVGVLAWWAPLVALGALLLSVVLLRRAAVRRRRAARARRLAGTGSVRPPASGSATTARSDTGRPGGHAAAGAARPAGAPTTGPARPRPRPASRASASTRPATTGAGRGTSGSRPSGSSTAGSVASRAPRPEDADESTQPIPVGAEPAPVTAGGTWDPVPVPPPTYTLKEKAERPEPEVYDDRAEPLAGEPAVYDDRVQDIEPEPEVIQLAEAVRRAANG